MTLECLVCLTVIFEIFYLSVLKRAKIFLKIIVKYILNIILI